MDFSEWLELNEMPITRFDLVGQWGPNDRKRGYNAQDIGILTSEKGVAKIKRLWSKTQHAFDLYFVRQPNAKKFLEEGEVSPRWVKENLNLDIVPREDAITVIYTNNIAGEKVPLTAWTIAHRVGHATSRSDSYETLRRRFKYDLNRLYDMLFPPRDNKIWGNRPDERNDLLPIMLALGTMRSARERNIRRPWEFLHELTAQYLIEGRVRLNPLPSSILVRRRMAWGNPAHQYRHTGHSPDKMQEVNSFVKEIEERINEMLSSTMDELMGRIFVI